MTIIPSHKQSRCLCNYSNRLSNWYRFWVCHCIPRHIVATLIVLHQINSLINHILTLYTYACISSWVYRTHTRSYIRNTHVVQIYCWVPAARKLWTRSLAMSVGIQGFWQTRITYPAFVLLLLPPLCSKQAKSGWDKPGSLVYWKTISVSVPLMSSILAFVSKSLILVDANINTNAPAS